MVGTVSSSYRRVLFALALIVAMVGATLTLAPDNASSMTGPTLSVTARGVDGSETLTVKRNNSTVGALAFGTSNSAQSIVLPAGATWSELELDFDDAPGRDLIVSGFSLDGENRSMVAGDVLVSGQWTGTGCSSLGPPIGATIHCNGTIQFPAGGDDPDPPPSTGDLDPSYWGNSQTVVPVYDTAWDMGVQVTLSQGEEYMDFLVDAGFSGFATTYLGAIHRPAARPDQMPVYTTPDGIGNPIASYDGASGNLIMDPDHADHFEDLLDAAHDRGLRVMLLVYWERKSVEEYGLLNEGNSYNWSYQIGNRFKDHPAIQTWTLGGDAGQDDPRTQLWTNAVNGLRDAGVAGDINFHTGSAPARRVNQVNASWNSAQLVQTSHCAGTALATSRLEGVMAQTDTPVWAGESRYEGIDATWCNPSVSIPTPQDIVTDALSFLDAGVQGIIYGHNERWQWGHGLEGSGGQGWTSVKQSFDAPGAYDLIEALAGTPPPTGDPIEINSPADGATGVTLPTSVSGTIQNPADVDFANIMITNADGSYVETYNKDIGFLIGNDGSWSVSAPAGTLLSSDQFTVEVYVEYSDDSIEQASSSFTIVIPDEDPPVVSSLTPVDGATVGAGPTDVVAEVSDNGSGVDRVRMFVRKNSTGEHWNGSAWVAAWSWVLASPDGAGSWAIPDVDLSDVGNYSALVWAWDIEGNLANYTANPQSTFVVSPPDATAPVVTNLSPLNGATVATGPVDVSVDVTDADSGVDRVRILVRKNSTGEYWNGVSWTSAWSWVLAADDGAGSWTIPNVDVSDAGSYQVVVWAWDVEGNLANYTGNPQALFTVEADDTAPVVTSLSPVDGATVSGLVDVSADVTDAESGVDRVRIYVRKNSTGESWNGSAWVSNWSWVAATSNGAGSWSIPNVDMSDAGSYQVVVWAWDAEGNLANYSDNPQSLLTVDSPDVDPPEVSSISPSDEEVVPSGLVDVSAQVSDVGSGVDRVRTLIRKNSTGEYWDGTAWTTNWSWVLATDQGLDSWVVPNVDVSDDGTYRVLVWAWDNENNLSSFDMNPASLFTVNPPVI